MADCEYMAEMISAWHDGELDANDVARVEKHLAECPQCRELKDRMSALDSVVMQYSPLPGPELEDRIEKALNHAIRESDSRGPQTGEPRIKESGIREPGTRKQGLRRLISLATAALILIAISLVLIVTGDRAEARRVANRYVESLANMSDQVLETQDAVLKTMEWDLNAMKLMLGCSEMETEEAKPLVDRIDSLLLEVERLQLSEKPSEQK